jgi:hypothetical protein
MSVLHQLQVHGIQPFAARDCGTLETLPQPFFLVEQK